MTAFAGGMIECFAGPREKAAPDDLETVIVDFIAGARRTLDIAVQELDNEAIAQAILDARFRGVSVGWSWSRTTCSTRGRRPTSPACADPARTGGARASGSSWGGAERPAGGEPPHPRRAPAVQCGRQGRLQPRDLPPEVRRPRLPRHGRAATSAILSGSANFTDTDCHRNLNHVVVFHDPRICQEYAAEFDQLRAGQFGRASTATCPAPTTSAACR